MVVGRSPDILWKWREADVELALWQRLWDSQLVKQLDALPISALPRFRVVSTPGEIHQSIRQLVSGVDENPVLSALTSDIEALTAHFANVIGIDEIAVRLDVIDHDACSLFHRDRAYARLLTTYLGPGTMWVPAACHAEALKEQRAYGGQLYEMSRFAVAIFRGSLSSSRGLVHRSPRLSGSGRSRLLLCLNATRAP
ncbi:MAG: DUF1826 domain-containing protein [Proteobacteria bacterium]|nr:DUF1826 domain-containing protein [Pseudomonadota bacterium]